MWSGYLCLNLAEPKAIAITPELVSIFTIRAGNVFEVLTSFIFSTAATADNW